MTRQITTVIFDLGGVLIDWNPRYVYRTIFDSEDKIDWFFEHITTSDWNENQDAGYPIAQATEELVAKHPEWEKEIRAYYGRWTEMLGGPIHDTVELFRQLKNNTSLKFYALTNWSAETFPIALERFDFLHWFDGRVVSGEEKTRKPFPEFYQRLLDRYSINPAAAVFIDDNLRNVKAAEMLGITGVHFQNPEQLKDKLASLL
ncbi:MAG TPA: HAD family phosphatase [Chitinophagaceae bacterium]|jgi:2-haloacid dehalogenase|nr:HAD family phosphatase [Chitinophagaceae bacterium]